ncbi:MAG: hypothetical protein OEV36_11665, partial [Myxococcales bacterium]|nr:hypothetical protein [Myxococcales bacterium]
MMPGSLTTGAAPTDAAASDAPIPVADVMKVSPFSFPRPTDDAVRRAKIIVVDDECSVVQLVSKYLRDAGFHNLQTLTES